MRSPGQLSKPRVNEIQATALEKGGNRGLQESVSTASVYRWLQDYEQSGGDLRALVPKTIQRGGKNESRLQPEVEAIIQSAIQDKYYVREATTIDDVLHEIAVRIDEENRSRTTRDASETPFQANHCPAYLRTRHARSICSSAWETSG